MNTSAALASTNASDRAAVLRRSNELMRRLITDNTASEMPFFCECEREGCFAPAWLTPAEYDAARVAGTPVEATLRKRDDA
jgi:hypothetical protein